MFIARNFPVFPSSFRSETKHAPMELRGTIASRVYKDLASNEAKKKPRPRQTSIGNRNHQCLNLALLRMRLIGLDDHLHQLVTDHVFVAEVDEVDAIDAGQDAFGLD
jgi:hypothetical protein